MTMFSIISSHSVCKWREQNAGKYMNLKIFYNNLYHRISDQKTSQEAILSTPCTKTLLNREQKQLETSLLLKISGKEEKCLDKFRTYKCVGLFTDESEQNELTLGISVTLCGIMCILI